MRRGKEDSVYWVPLGLVTLNQGVQKIPKEDGSLLAVKEILFPDDLTESQEEQKIAEMENELWRDWNYWMKNNGFCLIVCAAHGGPP